MSMVYECHSKKIYILKKKPRCAIDQNAFRFPGARPNMADAWIRNSDWQDDNDLKNDLAKFVSLKSFPWPLSDHDFVDLFISPVNVSLHGSGVWKLNCSFFLDDDYINTMTFVITAEKEKIPLFSSLGDWWDNLKIQIRRTCVNFSSQKRKKLLSECNSLTKHLLRAKSAVFAGDPDQISNVNKLESALEGVINSECKDTKIRLRAR